MKKHSKNIKKPLTALACGVLATTAFGLVGCDNKDLSSGKVYKGTDYSVVTSAENGDFFIDTDNYKLYQKIDGSWELIKENYGNDTTATIVDYDFVDYKSVYLLNEDFSLNNTKLRLFMSDNTYQDIALNTSMLLQSPDMSVAGIKIITIAYGEDEYVYNIDVQDSYVPTSSYAVSALNEAIETLTSSSKFSVETTSNDIAETYIVDNNTVFISKSNGVNNLQSEWLLQGNENTEKYLIEDANYTYSMDDSTLLSSSIQEYVDFNTSSVLSENIEEAKIASVEYLEGIVTIDYEKSSSETIRYIIENGNIIEVVKNGVTYNYSYNENSLDVPEIPVTTWNLTSEEVEEYLQESIAYSQSSINKFKKVSLYKRKSAEGYSKSTSYVYNAGGALFTDNTEVIDYSHYIVEGDYVWDVLQDSNSKNAITYSITDNKYARRETYPLGSSTDFRELAIRNCNVYNNYDVTSFSGTMTNGVVKSMEITMKYQESDTGAVRDWDYIYTYKIENGLVTSCDCVHIQSGEVYSHTVENYYYNEEFNDEIPILNTNLFPEFTAEEYLSNALSNLEVASKIKAELTEVGSSEVFGTILMDANANVMYSTSTNNNISEKWTIKEDDVWTGYWIYRNNENPYNKYTDSDSEGVTIYDKFLSLDGLNVTLHLNDEHLGETAAVYKIDGKVYIETMGGWTITIENGWIVSATDRIQTIQFTYGANNITETIPTLPDYDWE